MKETETVNPTARIEYVDGQAITILSEVTYGESKDEYAELVTGRDGRKSVTLRLTSYVRVPDRDVRLRALGWFDSITDSNNVTGPALVFEVLEVYADVDPDLHGRECPLQGTFTEGADKVSTQRSPTAVIFAIPAGADENTPPPPATSTMRRIRIPIN